MLGRLAESDAGIHDDVLGRHAGFDRVLRGARQRIDHFVDHVARVIGRRAIVHHDERHARARRHMGDGWNRAPHAVDHIGAELDRALGDRRLERVDRDRDVQRSPQRRDRRQHASRFFFV